MTALVSLKNISKRFGTVIALENVDLDLRVGEVVGLIGQNGCGKSTLLKVLAGLHAPDSGEVFVRGEKVLLNSALTASRLGIGLVHQEQSLIPNLKVAENIFLDKPNPARRLGWYSWGAMYAAARRQLEKIEVDIDPKADVDSLSFAKRQMVELAKVLAIEDMTNAHIVVLFDEPTAVLAPADIALLFRQIRRIKARASVVFVSHRIDEVMEICDRVVVMANCRKVAEVETANTTREELFSLIVGHQENRTAPAAPPSADKARPVRLGIKGLTSPGHFTDISFSLRGGEILGLAGGMGSGAEELCRALFGIVETSAGTVELNGRKVMPHSPAQAIAAGFGYVPADRKGEGALKGRTIAENMTLTYGLEYGPLGMIVDSARENVEVDKWMAQLKVRARSPEDDIGNLSGGNQQKAVMGKWLMSKSLQVLLLDHPTRGLDPGAREDLYAAIQEAAARGLSIIFVGDTVEEILSVSEKVIAMKDGLITANYDLAEASGPLEKDIVAAML